MWPPLSKISIPTIWTWNGEKIEVFGCNVYLAPPPFPLSLCVFVFCAGYPQALSGKMIQLSDYAAMQKNVYFFGQDIDAPWEESQAVQRYHLTLSEFPFRNLSPRELHLARQSGGGVVAGENNCVLFPAHAQLNLTLHRADATNLLSRMMIHNVNKTFGSTKDNQSLDERNQALVFGGVGLQPNTEHVVRAIHVKLHNVWLQVPVFFFVSFVSSSCVCVCVCRWCEFATRPIHRKNLFPMCSTPPGRCLPRFKKLVFTSTTSIGNRKKDREPSTFFLSGK